MAIPGKNADLIRRFKLYGFGLLLGTLIVSFVYKGKGCQLPGSAKMEELNWQQLQFSEKGECLSRCEGISKEEIKKILIAGKVNFDESEVHAEPYPLYAIEGKSSEGSKVQLMIEDIDTISKLVSVVHLTNETNEIILGNCDCD